tara:strand:+ start:2049 stop:2426 length:378 start_codon:yes stop_codon:yes gene_type:complete
MTEEQVAPVEEAPAAPADVVKEQDAKKPLQSKKFWAFLVSIAVITLAFGTTLWAILYQQEIVAKFIIDASAQGAAEFHVKHINKMQSIDSSVLSTFGYALICSVTFYLGGTAALETVGRLVLGKR